MENILTKGDLMKALLTVLTVCLMGPSVWGQSPVGQVSGDVRDASGAVVPEVFLEIRSSDDGRTYTVVSDQEGRYEFLRLPPGDYQLLASYQGFKSIQNRSFSLSAGHSLSLDLQFQIRDAEQSITVEGEVAPLDVSSPHLSYIIDESSFVSLPINGRSLEELALLAPGMVPMRAKDRRALNGLTQEISGNGARGTEFLMDGTDIQHPTLKTTPGGVSGLLPGMDSVQEFEVLNDAYPAYLGGSGGATVNIVSRRGTRDFHASAYEYYRDSAMDARNSFDQDIPPFDRHQYGANLGGPLPGEENTFFFSYEGLRERLGLTLFNFVPTVEARVGVWPLRPPETVGEIVPTETVDVSPDTQPLADLYPLPNGTDFDDGTAQYSFQQVQPTDDHFFNLRTDFRLGPSDSLFIRYTLHDSEKLAPFDVSIEGFDSDLASRNQYLTVEESHIFSPRLLHTTQFAYNRGNYEAFSVTNDPALDSVPPLIPGRPNFGRINVRGLSSFGTDTADLQFPFQQFQVSDTFQLSSGRHDLRWGFDWKHHRSDGSYNFFFDGLLVYENLRDFLVNDPQRFIGAEAGADSFKEYRQNLFALFIQDQYQLNSQLTLSYGLRYEFFTIPTEANGRISNLRGLMDSEPTVGDPLFENPSHLNFAPRLGLAWNVGGHDHTVLRTGFGVFYQPIRENIFGYRTRVQTPFMTVRTVIGPPYPNPLGGGRAGRPRQDPLQFDLSTPYVMRYHLMLQQALGGDFVLRVGFFGSRGVHLPRVGDINVPAPIGITESGQAVYDTTILRRGEPIPAPRPNGSFDAVRLTSTDANSVYNSLQIGVLRRFESGFQFHFNYTYGRSIDDASTYRREFGNSLGESPPNYYDRTAERGLSNFHVKHHAVLQYTWDLPSGFGPRSLSGVLLNDWEWSGILNISSGYPFEVNVSFDRALNTVREGQRPNLVPGARNNPALGGRDRYFDVNAFSLPELGVLGNLGRNTLMGPGFASLDMSLKRVIELGEDHRIEFRVEAFNLLNRANFSAPQNRGAGGGVILFNDASGNTVGNAPTIFSTTGTSRQLQLGFRWRY